MALKRSLLSLGIHFSWFDYVAILPLEVTAFTLAILKIFGSQITD